MKRALERAELALKDFDFDPEMRERLRTAIANAVIEERRALNNEIQYRLGNLKLSAATDVDAVRKEIEILLYPTPLL
jgi:hypothetical protein